MELLENLSSKIKTFLVPTKTIGLQIILITAFLSLKSLLYDNMGEVNEVDVLPLARQYADPTWIPNDWYLNQPPGYRLIFQVIFGNLAATYGFLATSIIGRIFCYVLVASGFVLVGRRLGLNLLFLLLALTLFIYIDFAKGIDLYNYKDQGVVTYEWIVGALETKAVAYGLVLLAIGWMLEGRYFLMAFLLGLATSFHVLVGGWTFIPAISWIALNRKNGFKNIQHIASVILIYLIGSALAIPAIWQQLFTPEPIADIVIPGFSDKITPSYIYVFLRLPHHLNPLSWNPGWWRSFLIYLLVLGTSVAILWWQKDAKQLPATYEARIGLAGFALLTLIPFAIGLAIAPFDTQGKLLQYYPFRVGDVMLPLITYFLLSCVLEQFSCSKIGRVSILLSLVFLGWVFSIQAREFRGQIVKIQQFPSQSQEAKADWKDICAWIRLHTHKGALVISPPAEFANFTWLSERPTLVKYKLLPQNKAGLLSWFNRLNDLSGVTNPWQTKPGERIKSSQVREKLTEGYNHLTTNQVRTLMGKYQANYFVTRVEHRLDLPVAYQNSQYVLYANEGI